MDLILFDGVCNLCNAFVQFIVKKDQKHVFKFAALQSDFAKKLLAENKITEPVQQDYETVYYFDGVRLYERSDAILKIFSRLPKYRWLGRLIDIFPKVFRDGLYRLTSSSRYSLFGKRKTCMMPTADLRNRFES